MPNTPITPDHPLVDREFVYRPDLPPYDAADDTEPGPGVLVVGHGFKVVVRAAFTDWNAVPGLDMLYVFVPATGLHTHVTPSDLGFVGPLVKPVHLDSGPRDPRPRCGATSDETTTDVALVTCDTCLDGIEG